MSTQENASSFNFAQLLIELSQDIEKREQFQREPSSFLANADLTAREVDALLSRDPHLLTSAFGYQAGSVPMEGQEEFIREIVRDEIKKSKKKKQKPPKKKKDKGPKKKKK